MDDEDLNLRLNGPGGAGDTINVPNCPFQLMMESKGTVLSGKLFFFNEDTLERYYVEAMTMDQFKLIAAAQYVTTQVVSPQSTAHHDGVPRIFVFCLVVFCLGLGGASFVLGLKYHYCMIPSPILLIVPSPTFLYSLRRTWSSTKSNFLRMITTKTNALKPRRANFKPRGASKRGAGCSSGWCAETGKNAWTRRAGPCSTTTHGPDQANGKNLSASAPATICQNHRTTVCCRPGPEGRLSILTAPPTCAARTSRSGCSCAGTARRFIRPCGACTTRSQSRTLGRRRARRGPGAPRAGPNVAAGRFATTATRRTTCCRKRTTRRRVSPCARLSVRYATIRGTFAATTASAMSFASGARETFTVL